MERPEDDATSGRSDIEQRLRHLEERFYILEREHVKLARASGWVGEVPEDARSDLIERAKTDRGYRLFIPFVFFILLIVVLFDIFAK